MNLQFVVSNQTNPFLNIAVENHLLACKNEQTITLYLWRNHRTVVIGQNQNPYSEVNMDALTADGGHLMRRRTGGGAVYHDSGNLNFSFIVPKALYDQPRQFEVLQRAVRHFGLHTEVSGRNDVLVEVPTNEPDGERQMRKFSGNAFSKGHYNNLHHGTILIHTNMDDLQRYLRPKPAKLRKHGVESVQSRVANLGDLCSDITAESIQQPLHEAFEQVYGASSTVLDFDVLASHPDVVKLRDEFASDRWRLGNWSDFRFQRSAQYEWGGVEIALGIEGNTIRTVQIASDALDMQAIDEAKHLLTGADIMTMPVSDNAIVTDILSLVYKA